MVDLLNSNQRWHLGFLVSCYRGAKEKGLDNPSEAALKDYFEENEKPELLEGEMVEMLMKFCSYVLTEGDYEKYRNMEVEDDLNE